MTATIDDVLAGRARWCVVEGDCLSVLQSIPDATIGAVVTDPPYSSGGQFRGDRAGTAADKYMTSSPSEEYLTAIGGGFSGDNRDQRSFAFWCALWLSEAQRACVPGAPVVQFTDWRQLPITTDAIQAGGWVWRGIFVWDKGDGGRPQKGRFRASSEFGVWGSNGPMPLDGECLPGSFRTAAPPGAERVHLTQKPLDLMRVVVRVAKEDAIVLDPFCGSGTTGCAAIAEGRRFIGIERDAGHAQTARERLAAESQGLTLRQARAGQTSLFGAGS